jgi:hypothetical protein
MNPDGSPPDIALIERLCAMGLDDCPPEDRATAWLLLSGVFPPTPQTWPSLKQSLHREYVGFVHAFGLDGFESKMFANTADAGPFDVAHPTVMEAIHGDIIRTSHHFIFFPDPDPDVERTGPEDVLTSYHVHMRRIERVLYVFAQLNPALSYLQGFNELASVLYYVFLSACPLFDRNPECAEAFVFFAFHELLATTKIHELFTTQDRSSLIHNRLKLFMGILKTHVPHAYDVIQAHEIHPLCFCFKWLNLLFAQEYDIPDLVLIWDALFAHFDHLVEYATYIAVARVKMLDATLVKDDYLATINALQRDQVGDIKLLLKVGDVYWAKDHTRQKKGIFGRFWANW